MFKKRTIKKKAKNIRKGDDSSDDEKADDPTSVAIEQAKKKRKLLETVQTKRGVDTADLLHAKPKAINNEDKRDPGSSSYDVSGGGGVLDQKHKREMEKYVNDKLKPEASQQEKSSVPDSTNKAKPLSEEALYSEIAESARKLSGKEVASVDADSGSGGAVLVAGTGIAEVVLPAVERKHLEKETQRARAARALQRKTQTDDLVPSRPEAVPNRFSVPSRPTHVPDGIHDYLKGSGQSNPGTNTTSEAAESTVDGNRVGFEALKMRQHGIKPKRKPHNPSSDQRVYQNFVTRQREMKK